MKKLTLVSALYVSVSLAAVPELDVDSISVPSLENILMLGKVEGRGRRGQQRMRWFDGITDSMDMGLVGL